MFQKLKTLLSIDNTDQDSLLCLLLEMTEDEVRDYCGIDDLTGLENTILQMAVIKYNRIGTEGLTAESYSAGSWTYNESYPENIKRALNNHRKLRLY